MSSVQVPSVVSDQDSGGEVDPTTRLEDSVSIKMSEMSPPPSEKVESFVNDRCAIPPINWEARVKDVTAEIAFWEAQLKEAFGDKWHRIPTQIDESLDSYCREWKNQVSPTQEQLYHQVGYLESLRALTYMYVQAKDFGLQVVELEPKEILEFLLGRTISNVIEQMQVLQGDRRATTTQERTSNSMSRPTTMSSRPAATMHTTSGSSALRSSRRTATTDSANVMGNSDHGFTWEDMAATKGTFDKLSELLTNLIPADIACLKEYAKLLKRRGASKEDKGMSIPRLIFKRTRQGLAHFCLKRGTGYETDGSSHRFQVYKAVKKNMNLAKDILVELHQRLAKSGYELWSLRRALEGNVGLLRIIPHLSKRIVRGLNSTNQKLLDKATDQLIAQVSHNCRSGMFHWHHFARDLAKYAPDLVRDDEECFNLPRDMFCEEEIDGMTQYRTSYVVSSSSNDRSSITSGSERSTSIESERDGRGDRFLKNPVPKEQYAYQPATAQRVWNNFRETRRKHKMRRLERQMDAIRGRNNQPDGSRGRTRVGTEEDSQGSEEENDQILRSVEETRVLKGTNQEVKQPEPRAIRRSPGSDSNGIQGSQREARPLQTDPNRPRPGFPRKKKTTRFTIPRREVGA